MEVLDKYGKGLTAAHHSKVILFNEIVFGESSDVQDPCFQSWNIYRDTAAHIEEGGRNIVSKLKSKMQITPGQP